MLGKWPKLTILNVKPVQYLRSQDQAQHEHFLSLQFKVNKRLFCGVIGKAIDIPLCVQLSFRHCTATAGKSYHTERNQTAPRGGGKRASQQRPVLATFGTDTQTVYYS